MPIDAYFSSRSTLARCHSLMREVEIRALMNQDVATDGTPLVQLYRQFQLDNHDRLDAPESRELIKRFEHHQAELAEHFEPSMIKA
jgi:hypothetical protein